MKKYTIELTEEELIRFYANKIIEDSLDDCTEFHYDMSVNQYEDNGFIEQHREQIIDRINKDNKVLEVYYDEEYSTINMCFGIDWCPYYYEDYYLDCEFERNLLRHFLNTELKDLEKVIDVRTTRDLIRQYMDLYIENSGQYEDEVKDAIYYCLKEHICNIGFVGKYIDKYEVYVTKDNIAELKEGLKNEIDKLYFKELPHIKELSMEDVHGLLDKFNNDIEFEPGEHGRFIAKENGIYLGIDNSTGEMFMEDFDDIRKCIDYINGSDLDELEEDYEEEP